MTKQWRAGLVNLREIMTNIINLGAVLQRYKIDYNFHRTVFQLYSVREQVQ